MLRKTGFRLRFWLLAVLILVLIVFSETLVHLLTESWWFESVGYREVFWTRLGWQVAIASLAFASWWIWLYLNYRIAQRITRHRSLVMLENRVWDPYLPGVVRGVSLALITLLAISAAVKAGTGWESVLKYLNPMAFGQQDPLFSRDISFYIFQLPLYETLHRAILELLVWSLIMALAVYGLKGEIRPERGWKYFLTGEAKAHLCLLLAGLALVGALGFWLARFGLLYSPTGVVYGAGYTDVYARLPVYEFMGVITLVIGGLFLMALWRGGFLLPLTAIGLYVGVFLLINGLFPSLQQKFVVEPNELEKETPYIEHNIALTRQAYNLDRVQPASFEVNNQLDATALSQNSATLDNIRLWDYRPLRETYSSLQTLRPYYRFQDVDIDRYALNNDYRQVMLSARELLYSALPDRAKTWVNEHLIYTHGYGVVMSPVNQVTPEGLPEFFIKDLPPQSSVDVAIEQPRIYYGEATEQFILTGTAQAEFDYPLGDENANYRYEGEGGVSMGSLGRRLAYAYDLGNVQLLLSNYITSETRIHYHRTIRERVAQLVPFLQLDSDPYMVVLDGRLQWIMDGYTLSNRYPYAEPLYRSDDIAAIAQDAGINAIARAGTNYIRNAVKIVVDAYDGSMQFYVIDEIDPILAAYQQIFPTLFKSLEQAPVGLKAHFRYPLNLFKIQAHMYRTYHMERPEVFYNREDLWSFPTQVSRENTTEIVEPYYVIMRLPGGDTAASREEFMLILPFTPVSKNNMVAWMTARCDGEQYGNLLNYEFSRQALIYGPRQIDTRIDQNPEISEQLTLWNQEGSEVFRGDLLVIPIEQSLLYVEPVYLQATGQNGAIPELKRVIVAYDDNIIMGNTLDEALNEVFGQQVRQAPAAAPEAVAPSSTPAPRPAQLPTLDQATRQQLEAALKAYESGQAALQQGDWEAYGQAQERLGEILRELGREDE
jgi:uncharacterized membrane protein (UPF0182 family)